MVNVFIVGAKSLGNYGGFETFADKLTEYHQHSNNIRYHVACKAGGYGSNNGIPYGAQPLSDREFIYHNAHCFNFKVPDIGPAQAVYYDLAALSYFCSYIEKHSISDAVIYILACRVGPFAAYFKKRIEKSGARMFINPDGHEWMRAKWSAPVKAYWKLSEKLMVKNAHLVVCDSMNIKKYIDNTYRDYGVKTAFIPYGAELPPETAGEHTDQFEKWMQANGVRKNSYYLTVGRLVPENNYKTMIAEFMKSDTEKDFVIITNKNPKYFSSLAEELGFEKDSRIKFVSAVYDKNLLAEIRKNAYGYIHGHQVGGTNPTLLEALAATQVNLLLDVSFNKEVAQDGALYWKKDADSLSELINYADTIGEHEAAALSEKAKERIKTEYNWQKVADDYHKVFCT